MAESLDLILSAGGLPVLAHPTEIDSMEALLPQLKQAGIVGLEVYYKDYRPTTVRKLQRLAQKYGFIACGGTDYHGFNDVGNEIGKVKIPGETVDQLMALARQRKSKCLNAIAV